MTKAEKENQITALKNLGLTDEEIAEVLADDEKIDKGAKLFELPEELEKGAKKARNVGNTAGYTKPKERAKAEDRQKRFLIDIISNALNGHILGGCSMEITNPEREINFEYCNRKFKIVLSCPRK
jgi:hypothetical protein